MRSPSLGAWTDSNELLGSDPSFLLAAAGWQPNTRSCNRFPCQRAAAPTLWTLSGRPRSFLCSGSRRLGLRAAWSMRVVPVGAGRPRLLRRGGGGGGAAAAPAASVQRGAAAGWQQAGGGALGPAAAARARRSALLLLLRFLSCRHRCRRPDRRIPYHSQPLPEQLRLPLVQLRPVQHSLEQPRQRVAREPAAERRE